MDLFRTVVAGVLVFVGGQVVIRALIEPWLAYRELVGRIAHAVVLHSTPNPILGPEKDGEEVPLASGLTPEEAIRTFRSLWAELNQRTYAIIGYGAMAAMRLVPTRWDIHVAATNLIGLSNNVEKLEGKMLRTAAIRARLRIYDPDAPPEKLRARLRRRIS